MAERNKINFHVSPHKSLLAIVKRQKLACFGWVMHHDSLSKTILQGILQSGRRRCRQRKCWKDNVKEWTSLPMSESGHPCPCQRVDIPVHVREWTSLPMSESGHPCPCQRVEIPAHVREWKSLPMSESGHPCPCQRVEIPAHVKEWTSLPMSELLTIASRRKDWEKISAES